MQEKGSARVKRTRLSWVVFTLVFATGIVARIIGAYWYQYSRNPDYAVIVQMARHAATGRGWPVFYYGQPYMGSLEPSVSALLVMLFGPSPFVICMGTALFGIALLLAVRAWAADVGGRWAGVVAVAIIAIGPISYFHYMASPRGGYALALCLTVLLLREAARMAGHACVYGSIGVRKCAWLGLLGGLGFWNFWLTLPALAAAGIALLIGLRWRILRRRVWLPGLLGFTIGSLPFWVWNITHQWASLGSDGGMVTRGQALTALKAMVSTRLPALLDIRFDALDTHGAMVIAAYLFLLMLALWMLWPRHHRRGDPGFWMLVVTALYAFLFCVAYALSSFNIPNTPRYLLPFIPVFAALAGAAVARCAATMASAPRSCVRTLWAVLVCVGMLAIGTIIEANVRTIPHHRMQDPWYQSAQQLPEVLAARGTSAAFVGYTLYGINWVTDEQVCASSPELERYAPYAQKLERTDSPAVIENFRGFDHFLLSTSTTSSFERVGTLRVHSEAVAPAGATVPLPAEHFCAARTSDGPTPVLVLVDQLASTVATVKANGKTGRWIDLEFDGPTDVCGIRIWTLGRDTFDGWAVEGRVPNTTEFTTLSPLHVNTPYYWSGPRFYAGGDHLRAEKRFAPIKIEALRIRFLPHGDSNVVRIPELQVLQPAVATQPDVSALADVVREHKIRRVFADRWLANQLHDALNGTVWTSREQSVFGENQGGTHVTVAAGTAIAATPDTVASVRQGLTMLHTRATETVVGDVTLFELTDGEKGIQDYYGLRFNGIQLLHANHHTLADALRRQTETVEPAAREELLQAALDYDSNKARTPTELTTFVGGAERPDEAHEFHGEYPQVLLNASFFDGKLILVGLSTWPSVAKPGETFGFEALWRVAPGFVPSSSTILFIHFLQGTKIQFQIGLPLDLNNDALDPQHDTVCRTYGSGTAPIGTGVGVFTPALGLYTPGLLGGRIPMKTTLPMSRNRVIIPGEFEIKE